MAAPSNAELRKFVPEPVAPSNLTDRLLAVAIYGGIGVLAAGVFVTALGLVPAGGVPGAAMLGAWLDAPGEMGLLRRVGAAVGACLTGLIAINLLLSPYLSTRGPRRLVIAADDLGLVIVEPSSVCGVAAAQVLRIRGVVDAQASLIAWGSSPLRLRLDVQVVGTVDLKIVGEQARKAAADAVQGLIGMPVQSVMVHFTVVPVARLQRVLE